MAESKSATALTFHEIAFDLVEHSNGEPWVRGWQIASALGYQSPHADASNLYERNAAEFTDSMTALVKLPTAGGVQDVRIFSPRGAYLLGMFAKTKRAAEFRRWVLDVLEHETAPPQASLPPPIATDQVLSTLRRVVAERDKLRDMLAERTLKEQPQLRKVMYYYSLSGLNNTERAKLMGWKGTTEWFRCLKLLAALGLVDYEPDPAASALGKRNMQKAAATMAKRKLTKPQNMRAGQPAEHMAKMRAARQAQLVKKDAAK